MKLEDIRGLGPKKLQKLKDLEIVDIIGLKSYMPLSYEDRSKKILLSQCQDRDKHYFELKITSSPKTYFFKRKMSITRLMAEDESKRVNLVWYNDRFSPQALKPGNTYKIFGIYDKEKNSISNPIFSNLDDDYIGGIYPIYSLVKGLNKKDFIKFKDQAFEKDSEILEYLPKSIIEDYDIMDYDSSLKILHRPESFFDLYQAKKSILIRELLVEAYASRLDEIDDGGYISFNRVKMDGLIDSLDFTLTEDQHKAFHEIYEDMASEKRMNRILIGDVGSGKTIVAILSALVALKNTYQVAFLAPTEILAIQHYNNYKSMIEGLGYKAILLTGSTPDKEKELIYERLEAGSGQLVFGTHAVFQEKVRFKKLGLVITDEQQRFGVYQRRLMADKGSNPDNLLLSATPIPRTLALTMYRDLDLSIINKLPKNRQPISSYLVSYKQEKKFVDFALDQVQKGHQVYVVVPRVYDDEGQYNSLEKIYKAYKSYCKSRARVGYIHGKLTNEEKSVIQEDFVQGKIDILIATSIIEVGIDVKNANCMIIYDANMFGLAQLHQLRGRVGRGDQKSYCFFVSSEDKKNDEKLEYIANHSNGFDISKKDLELRGAGDRMGIYQSGFISDDSMNLYDESLYEKVDSIVDRLLKEKYHESSKAFMDLIGHKMVEYKKIIMN